MARKAGILACWFLGATERFCTASNPAVPAGRPYDFSKGVDNLLGELVDWLTLQA